MSKEGQRKENRRDRTSMRRFQRRAENRERRKKGLLQPRRASGTHNGKHRIRQPHRQPLPPIQQWINPQNHGSIPNGENMFADLFFSHNAPALSHTTRTDEADNRPCYMTS